MRGSKTSPNFRSSEPDDTKALGLLLGDTRARSNERLILIILRCLKIVSRKVQTRASIPPAVLAAVNAHVKAPKTSRVAREAVSVVLNSCYERQHVDAVVADDVVPALVAYLSADDPELQAAAAGALQSVVCTIRVALQHVAYSLRVVLSGPRQGVCA